MKRPSGQGIHFLRFWEYGHTQTERKQRQNYSQFKFEVFCIQSKNPGKYYSKYKEGATASRLSYFLKLHKVVAKNIFWLFFNKLYYKAFFPLLSSWFPETDIGLFCSATNTLFTPTKHVQLNSV